jgi:hypothetical protein
MERDRPGGRGAPVRFGFGARAIRTLFFAFIRQGIREP